MTKRFRMIAGPNGSGKSMLTALLRNDRNGISGGIFAGEWHVGEKR